MPKTAQPHDQTERRLSSFATSLAASACSFVTSSQESSGACSRPPEPGVVWKPSMIPSLRVGIPSAVYGAIRFRNSSRTVRPPVNGPSLATLGAAKYDSLTMSA